MGSKILMGYDKVVLKMALQIQPEFFFLQKFKKMYQTFSSDCLKIFTWKRKWEAKAEAEAVPFNFFGFRFHPKRPKSGHSVTNFLKIFKLKLF